MGSKHSCSHETSGFTAAAAKNSNGKIATGKLMGNGEAHQSTTEDQHLLLAHG
jgi:hypothetical protein